MMILSPLEVLRERPALWARVFGAVVLAILANFHTAVSCFLSIASMSPPSCSSHTLRVHVRG